MRENFERFPVAYDETTKAWIVKTKEGNVSCHTEDDAMSIASIPELYKESTVWKAIRHNQQRLKSLVTKLDKVNSTSKLYYVNSVASRELERIAKKIRETVKDLDKEG